MREAGQQGAKTHRKSLRKKKSFDYEHHGRSRRHHEASLARIERRVLRAGIGRVRVCQHRMQRIALAGFLRQYRGRAMPVRDASAERRIAGAMRWQVQASAIDAAIVDAGRVHGVRPQV